MGNVIITWCIKKDDHRQYRMCDATKPTQTTKGLSLLAKVSNPKGIANTFYWKHSSSSNKDPSTVFYINTLHCRGIFTSKGKTVAADS